MDKCFKFLFIALLLGITFSIDGIAQVTISAEVRPRAEYRHGFKKPLESSLDPAFFVEQRTRLNSSFISENFDVYISLQDVRIWGAVNQIYKTDPALQNIYQAWGAYKISPAHSIAVGRMELEYDNARVLGNLDWATQGRSHDLVKYMYTGEASSLHIGAAFNQDATTPEFAKLAGTYYSGVINYKTMQFLRYHKDWTNNGLSLLFINNGMQAPDSTVNFSQTLGAYGTSSLGSSALEYELYYQFGKNAAGADVSGLLVAANVTFFKAKPHNLALGFDYLSGDKADTEKDESFDPLYGTHHKFYGFMDYFYVGNGHMKKGIADAYVKAKFKTGEKSALLAHVHEFFSGSEISGTNGENLSSALGTEIDLVYNLNLATGVSMQLGYSQMIYSDSMEFIKEVADPRANASWAWAMISFKPTLFTTKSN